MRDERGHAVVEVCVVGVLIVAVLVWLLGTLSGLHRAALGLSDAVREAGADAARAEDRSSAAAAIDRVAGAVLLDAGIDPRAVDLRWSASPGWPRGGRVDVALSYDVDVFPPALLGDLTPTISVTAAHSEIIDRYRSR
ncbi:MAG TPA: hypothetical protein VFK89_06965 [Actinomycetota bacterium]|nr:hypothetical protein [Actinomycetota bacterium]